MISLRRSDQYLFWLGVELLEPVSGPVTLRLEARYKNCKILGQNDGTFVTFLRDKTVTYPATLTG